MGYKIKYYRFGIVGLDGTLYYESVLTPKESGLPDKISPIDLKVDPETYDMYLISSGNKIIVKNLKIRIDCYPDYSSKYFEIYKIKAPKKLEKPRPAGKIEGENPYNFE